MATLDEIFKQEDYKGFKIIASPALPGTFGASVFVLDGNTPHVVWTAGTSTSEAKVIADAKAFVDLEPGWFMCLHHIGEDVLEMRECRCDAHGEIIESRKLPVRKFYTEEQRLEAIKIMEQENFKRGRRDAAQVALERAQKGK